MTFPSGPITVHLSALAVLSAVAGLSAFGARAVVGANSLSSRT
jgi:hypothetical protein